MTLGSVLFMLLVATTPAAADDVEVYFSVDMGLRMSLEQLDPATDEVAVRGSVAELGSWTPPGVTLEREGATSIYSGWVQFDGLSSAPVEYKFVVHADGDPAQVKWESYINNRSFQVAGGEPDDVPPGGNGYVEIVPATPYFDHAPEWSPSDRVIGADISGWPYLQSMGVEFTVGGVVTDPLEIYRLHGFSVVRLRLWHTPAEPWHGTAATLAFAQECVAAGFDIMLDFHYSDSWADPGKQYKPAAWETLSFPALVDSIYAYTNNVIRTFRDGGALPKYVQVGNEINPGFLWDDGRVGWQGSEWDTPEQWTQFTTLVSAGIAAVRDSLPPGERPKIVIHSATGGDNATSRWFYDNLIAYGVDFDIIGLSHYPWWHGSLWDLKANLHDLALAYGKEIQVVETAYPWTLDWNDDQPNFVGSEDQLLPGYDATPDGQLWFLRDIVAAVEGTPGGLGTAVMYWAPDGVTVPGGPGNPYENLTLFDFDNEALPGIRFVVPWGTGVDDAGEEHGAAPLLHRARPNPFASDTALAYVVPEGGADVTLRIFDVSGRLVRTLVDAHQEPGSHELHWDRRASSGATVAAGVYFVHASIGGREGVEKVVVR